MAKPKATIGVINLDQICKQLDKLEKAPEKVINSTLKDFRTSAPIWVAEAVIKQYNIAKVEVKPRKQGEKELRTGRLQVNGKTIGTAAIVYKGRPLTITHFEKKITGRKHPGTGTASITASIKKGGKAVRSQSQKITKKQRYNIGRNFTKQGKRNSPKSPLMMLYTGNKQPGGTNRIPFGRQSQRRNDLKPFKTVSLPQMVDNEEVKRDVNMAIETKLGKRLEKHMKYYMSVEKR